MGALLSGTKYGRAWGEFAVGEACGARGSAVVVFISFSSSFDRP